MTKRRNPFDYGGPVSGDHFAGRTREVAAVVNRLTDHVGIVVTAPRRYGKSSLVKQACEELERKEPSPAVVHVNLLQAGSLTTVAALLLRRLYQVPGGPWHTAKNTVPGFLRRIRMQPTTTFDASGAPTFTFAPGFAPAEISRVFDDAYATLNEIGRKRPAVLFLDEFQAVADLDEHLPRQLKALADQYRNVAMVLAGSKQHLMESLVLAKGAPLYNMLERMSLGPIPEEDWVPFLLRRAHLGGRPFADETTAHGLWDIAGPVPFDVQQMAYESFNQAGDYIDRRTVEVATSELVHHQAADYARVFERLSPGQRRVLKVLARGPRTTGSAEFAQEVELANAASVGRAIQALVTSELVVQCQVGYAVDDPFFAAWLRGADGEGR